MPSIQNVVYGNPLCLGSLGLTLKAALEEVSKELILLKGKRDDEPTTDWQGDDNDVIENVDSRENHITLDRKSVEQIMITFGAAVEDSLLLTKEEQHCSAPAVILRGRLESYNHYNDKWRISVDDAELTKRNPLHRNRRKRERASLWQLCEERIPIKGRSEHKKVKLEMMVYNDV